MAGARGTEGELKLYGLAAEAARNLRGAAADAWWLAWPPDKAVVFTLHTGQAAFAGRDINRSLMTVRRWSPRSGCSAAPRAHDDHPRAAAAPSSSREYAQGSMATAGQFAEAVAGPAALRPRTGRYNLSVAAEVCDYRVPGFLAVRT